MIEIREMVSSDSEAVLRIYQEGMDTGHATFQTEAPKWRDWNIAHINDLRFVAIEGGLIAGWIALSPVSSRCVYSGVAEVSVYVSSLFKRRGVASTLLEYLIRESEAKGYWTLQAGIFSENIASIQTSQKAWIPNNRIPRTHWQNEWSVEKYDAFGT